MCVSARKITVNSKSRCFAQGPSCNSPAMSLNNVIYGSDAVPSARAIISSENHCLRRRCRPFACSFSQLPAHHASTRRVLPVMRALSDSVGDGVGARHEGRLVDLQAGEQAHWRAGQARGGGVWVTMARNSASLSLLCICFDSSSFSFSAFAFKSAAINALSLSIDLASDVICCSFRSRSSALILLLELDAALSPLRQSLSP
jgi:hypothetical protein